MNHCRKVILLWIVMVVGITLSCGREAEQTPGNTNELQAHFNESTFDDSAKLMEEIVEEKYKAWNKYCLGKLHSSYSSVFINNEPFQEIVALGIPALPYIIEKVKQESEDSPVSISIFPAFCHITKANLAIKLEKKNGKLIRKISGFPHFEVNEDESTRSIWLRWWHNGRRGIPEYFETVYREWKELKEKGKTIEAKEKFRQIKKMGLFALPYVMGKIAEGETELIPLASYLTDKEVNEDAKPQECISWWNKNKEKWIIP